MLPALGHSRGAVWRNAPVLFSPRIADPGIWRRQSKPPAVLPHGELLVGLDFQIRTRKRGAQQDKLCGAILRKVSYRVTGINFAGLH